MDFAFQPHARYEVRNIQWFAVADLPVMPAKKNGGGNGTNSNNSNMASKFFTVYPFMMAIRKWIERERRRRRREAKRKRRRTASSSNSGDNQTISTSETVDIFDSGVSVHSRGNGNGAETSGGEDNGGPSVSNSPYTVMPTNATYDTINNESTSFVDVNLDAELITTIAKNS